MRRRARRHAGRRLRPPRRAALPGLAGSGLTRETRRGLAIERERVRAAAATRAPVLQRAGRALAEAGLPAWLYNGKSKAPYEKLTFYAVNLHSPRSDQTGAGFKLTSP